MRKVTKVMHPRYADCIEVIESYLEDAGKSARWLGIQIANDPRMMPKIIAGRLGMEPHIRAICARAVAFYTDQCAREAVERTRYAALDDMNAHLRSAPITARRLAGPPHYASQLACDRAAA